MIYSAAEAVPIAFLDLLISNVLYGTLITERTTSVTGLITTSPCFSALNANVVHLIDHLYIRVLGEFQYLIK